jgi:hypothetical protein
VSPLHRVLACGLIGLFLASAAAAAGNRYAKLSLRPDSKKGALIFRAVAQPLNWTMILTPVDAAGRTRGFGTSLNMGGTTIVPTRDPAPLQIWMMKPGRYVIRFLKTQNYWAGCLAPSTLSIDIAAGQASYIGVVDPAPTLGAIEREVIRTGKSTSRGGIKMMHQGIPPPAVSGAAPGDLARIGQEVRSAAPGVVAPIVLVRPAPASFPRKPESNPLAACG